MKAAVILAALALAGQAAPALDPALTVADFLRRWTRIEGLKEMAIVDPDMRALGEQMGLAVGAWKAELDADEAAGRRPRACPVKGTTAKLESPELLAELRAIPEEKRGMLFRDAMFAYLDKRFPCPAVTPSSP